MRISFRSPILAIASIVVAGDVDIESTESLLARRGDHICWRDTGPPVNLLPHDIGAQCETSFGNRLFV